jgi:hypothetical protein
MSDGSGTRDAIVAGVRKIPDPIVIPITTPTAGQNPNRRGSCDSADDSGPT